MGSHWIILNVIVIFVFLEGNILVAVKDVVEGVRLERQEDQETDVRLYEITRDRTKIMSVLRMRTEQTQAIFRK